MPAFNIPPQVLPVLKKLAGTSAEDFDALLKAVAALPVYIKPERITASVGDHKIQGLSDTVRALIALSFSRFQAEVPRDAFIEGIVESSLVPPDKQTLLAERLKALLDIQAFELSARAFAIQHEYEKVLRSVRIVSDIRPVFTPSATDVEGLMIVHNLKISYTDSGHYKEAVFAMDDEDVVMLKRALERAETKTKTMERFISKNDLHYFESK
jgi:hypothetical protein